MVLLKSFPADVDFHFYQLYRRVDVLAVNSSLLPKGNRRIKGNNFIIEFNTLCAMQMKAEGSLFSLDNESRGGWRYLKFFINLNGFLIHDRYTLGMMMENCVKFL